jgi:hypothetical protein
MAKGPIEFVVVGRGEFPVDMLRYDSCYPADSSAVEAITTPRNPDWTKVRLRTHKERKMLTPDRWTSFGWVIELEGR